MKILGRPHDRAGARMLGSFGIGTVNHPQLKVRNNDDIFR